MTLAGIPISEDQCIGDSLEYLNGAFQTLSANLLSLSATGGSLNIVDSANIDLTYQSTSKVLSAVVSVSGASSGQMMTFNGTQWGGARPFPTWNSTPQTSATNNQIGSGWVNYRAALLDTIRNNDVIVGDRLTTPNGTYPSTAGAFFGGVLLKDGRVLLVPHSQSTGYIYNPATNSVTTAAGGASFGSDPNPGFHNGVLLPDGRVFCIPAENRYGTIYNPTTDTVTQKVAGGVVFNSTGDLNGGVLLPNGKVFCVPGSYRYAPIYDPSSNTMVLAAGGAAFHGGGTGFTGFTGGVLLPNGKVFCVPSDSTTARIYDPVADTLSTPSGTYPGTTNAFNSGVLLPNGKVFCVPGASTTARIYDPVADTLSTPSGTYPGTTNTFVGGMLLPNGKIFLIPSNNTTARIYDPVADTLSTPSGTYPGSDSFAGGILLPNGKVFCVPYNSTTARIYDPTNTYDTVSLDINFVTSPFNNKF